MSTRPLHRGTVVAFSDDDGLGEVALPDGRRFPFHCTAVADGSRHVDVGTAVTFSLVAAHHGRTEARPVTPV